MAKARQIGGIERDTAYAAAAARIVAVRSDELIENSRDVLDIADIERVHDMRVATRRLRAALEIFRPCFPRAEFRVALRDVKALADALGERRDRDVAIAGLERVKEALAAPDRRGIASLIDELRIEQSGANEELARFVESERLAALHTRLKELVAAAETDRDGPLALERELVLGADGADPQRAA